MTRTLKGFMNLGYIEVRHVPYVESKRFGRGTDSAVLKSLEQLIARKLLVDRIPLRGTEVLFFRSVLGMSQKQLGLRLGYSDVAILKWERNKLKRLEPVNEVAVRALMAGFFGVKLLGTFDTLLGVDKGPKKLVIDYEGAAEEDAA